MKKKTCFAKWIVCCAGCAGVMATAAFPSKAELDKAQKIVGEVMSQDISEFNSKRKTASDVAAAALGYVDEAESDAAKFLLLKGAFYYQMRALDYDGAARTVGRIRSEIKDVPDKLVADMLSGALRRVPRKHCGQLYDLLQRMQNRARYAKEVESMQTRAKMNPADKGLHDQLGERYALLDNWEKAVGAFAAGSGRRAEMAQWELKYPETGVTELTTAKVADFWWDAAPADNDDLMRAYRRHAAYWYGKAIENNALQGLKKTLAEKRIEEVERDNPTEEGPAGPSVAAPAAMKDSLKVQMGRGITMELVQCPAGTFTMGYSRSQNPNDPHKAHKVKISRQFWIGRFEVTREQWCTLMPPVALDPVSTALGGMKAPISNISRQEMDGFCEKMNRRHGRLLPKGYVFRLPTEAEWEYACRADAQPGTPYWKPNGLSRDEGFPIAVRSIEKAEVLRKAGVAFDDTQMGRIPGMVGGRKKPNGWGIFDMIGNIDEVMLDKIPSTSPDGKKLGWGSPLRELAYVDAEDPLMWTAGGNPWTFVRANTAPSTGWAGMKKAFPLDVRVHAVGFRIVAGPDLLKEKKYRR